MTRADAIDSVVAETAVENAAPGFGARHFQCFLLFGLLVFAYGLRVNLSVAIVAMTDKNSDSAAQVFDWTENQQGIILSSFFWGYFITQVPASQLAHRFGPRILLFIASLGCAAVTIATPFAASLDWRVMLLFRALQGAFQGIIYPGVHMMIGKWVHPNERGKITTFTYSGTQLGTVLILAVSGLLAATPIGWPSIFYVTGGLTLIWSIFWFIFGCNSPHESTSISKEEMAYLESGLGASNGQKLDVPWQQILTSVPVWALVIVHCGQCWGFWTYLTETPTFLKQKFHLDIKTNAFLSALPYTVMWILSLLMSPVSDMLINRGYMTTCTSRKLFNSISHWGPAILFIILPFTENAGVVITLLTIGVGINAFSYVGYMCNHMDLSPNFSGSLMGFTNSIANIMSILGPLTVGFILTGSSNPSVVDAEWKTVFFLSAAIYIIGNLVFVIFGKAEIQKWNEPADRGSSESTDKAAKSN